MRSLANSLIFATMFVPWISLALPIQAGPTSQTVRAIDSLMAEVPDFSGVVLVGEGVNKTYHKAFGYRDFRTMAPMDTGCVFELASISKTFTATLVLRLVQEKKIGLDDPVEKYIDPFPYAGITVRHLLNHTSGLPDYQAIMDKYWDKSKVAGNKDCIDYLIRYQPDPSFPPGKKYEYSNTGYLLLATIAERASGKEFISMINQYFLRPLGMSHTAFRSIDEKRQMSEMAWGFIPEGTGVMVSADSFPSSNYTIWLGDRKGPGRISSTASDLLKWHQGLYSRKVINPSVLKLAFRPGRLNDGTETEYGFGWEIRKVAGRTMVGHSGNNPGYRTFLLRDISTKRAVILLSNNSAEGLEKLAEKIMTMMDRLR